jgi:PAS domain S-box-containing protein
MANAAVAARSLARRFPPCDVVPCSVSIDARPSRHSLRIPRRAMTGTTPESGHPAQPVPPRHPLTRREGEGGSEDDEAGEADEASRLRSVAMQNAHSILAARRRAEDELRRQSAWLRVTLASIGDALIATDAEGRVSFMNGVAEMLTGWIQADAMGHPLTDVFRIVDEERREPVDNPAVRSLAEGVIVGLANHTLLVARDGTERPIDDSAAPIRSESGEIIGCVLVFRDVTERRRAERELRKIAQALRESETQSDRQRRVYEAILTNTPDFAYVIDLQHRFTYANENLLKMWGFTREQAIGRTFLELGYEPWHAALHCREVDQVAATGLPLRGEVPFSGTFGRRIYDYIFVPVFGADGTVEAVAGTTRDVTDHKHAEEEREALLASERSARAEAERASRVKEDFLATLSHELRTPLSAILGWTQILLRKPPTRETLEQGLTVIDRNARMQAQLIADLLDMSRIISGKMQMDVQRVELPVIIEAAMESVRPAAEARGVTLQSELVPVAESVHGDPTRLQQVVWNLLSNAVKFTPRDGSVTLSLTRVDSRIAIAVRDTGKGIRADFLPHVFERFRQADSSAAREYAGLGLGLAIVKQLVELHGGSVQAVSAGEGLGSTFTVFLPVSAVRSAASLELGRANDATARRALAAASASCDAPLLAGVRVLVVDDEPDARDLVRRVLEDCQAEVIVASSADTALAAAVREHPDVIVSDIGLPGIDGYAFMRALRRSGNRVPAAALTAFARSEDRTRALQAGFQTHIVKPVEPAELIAAVAALVHKSVPDTESPGG